jgi:hypothetical protein
MINSWLIFQPVFPISFIFIIGILFFAWLAWKEYKRNIKFLLWRMIALIMLTLSLLGIILQPYYQTESRSSGLVVLTPHYQSTVVDSLLNRNSSLRIARTADAEPYPGSKIISSASEIANTQFIVGDGLPPYLLQEIQTGYTFLKGKLPYGIINWVTPNPYKANHQNEINGVFHAKEKTILKLKGPEGAEDSISFAKAGTFSFKLFLKPRQTGQFLYAVNIREGSILTSHKFPVYVQAEKKMNVFISVKYPTAEARYLKNFLIEKGHSVVARFQVSKNNFKYEYGNQKMMPVSKLTSEVLNYFDLMIVDNELLESLSTFELNQLEESLKQGLGLLVLHNSVSTKNNTNTLSLPLIPFKSDTTRVILGASSFSFPALAVRVNCENVTPIFQTKERVVSGYVLKGQGKIAFQLLQETYRLQLEGKNSEYALLWTPIIEAVSKIQNSKFKIEIAQPFPIYTDEPMTINVIAAQSIPALQSDNVLLPLRENVVIDDYWHGTTWAGKIGWHTFSIDSTSLNYYVSDPTEWQSLRIAQQQKMNTLATQKKITDEEKDVIITEQKPVSRLLFFLLFLMAAGFLWLVPKL